MGLVALGWGVAQGIKGVYPNPPLDRYRDLLGQAHPEAVAQTARILGKARALERVKDQLGPDDRFHVEETTRRYLPDTMNAYRLATAAADGEQREARRSFC